MRLRLLTVSVLICLAPMLPYATAQRPPATKKPAAVVKGHEEDASRMRALQMLEAAESGTGSLDAVSRAEVLYQLARIHQRNGDKAKVVPLLQQAFADASGERAEKTSTQEANPTIRIERL